MSKYIIDEYQLSSLADAIRNKTGSNISMSFDGMIDAVSNITTGGDQWIHDLAIPSSTIVDYNGSIFNLTFSGNTYIMGVSMPNCVEIGQNAFASCSNISFLSLPKVKKIGSSAFRYPFSNNLQYGSGSDAFTVLDLPECEEIGSYAFCGNPGAFIYSSNYISVLSTPKVKKLGDYAFACWWNNLRTFSFPELEYIGSYVCSTDGQVSYKSIYFHLSKIKYMKQFWAARNNFYDLGTGLSFPDIRDLELPECIEFCWNEGWTLSSLSIPKCTSLAFWQQAQGFNNIYAPSVEYIKQFRVVTPTTEFEFTNCNDTSAYAFQYANFSKLSLPNLSRLNGYTFANAYMKEIYIPNVSQIGNSEFYVNTSLSKLTISSDLIQSSPIYSNRNDVFTNTSLFNTINGTVYISANNNSSQFLYSADHSITDYTEDVTGILGPGFYSCANLSRVSCSNIRKMCFSTCMFSGCINLTEINFPNLSMVMSLQVGLTSANANSGLSLIMPNLKYATTVNVTGCNYVYLPKLRLSYYYSKSIGDMTDSLALYGGIGLAYCSQLILPAYSGDMYSWFISNSYIVSVNLDNARLMRMSMFYRANKLESAMFPLCSYVASDCFSSCTSLSIVQLSDGFRYSASNGLGISAYTFNACTKLSIFIMAGKTPNSCYNVYFGQTPISNSNYLGYFGSIYVRASLIYTYKTLLGWSAYKSRFTSLEDLPSSIYTNLKIPFSIGSDWFACKMSSTFSDWINSYNNTLDFYMSDGLIYNSVGSKVSGITYSSIIDLDHDEFIYE